MIDYDKLRIAHELADKIGKRKEITISVQCDYRVNSIFPICYILWLSDPRKSINFVDIDHLITKLRELIQKEEPKKESWFIDGEFKITSYNFTDEEWKEISESRELLTKDAPSKLYPTKSALIEAQIEYWLNQREPQLLYDIGKCPRCGSDMADYAWLRLDNKWRTGCSKRCGYYTEGKSPSQNDSSHIQEKFCTPFIQTGCQCTWIVTDSQGTERCYHCRKVKECPCGGFFKNGRCTTIGCDRCNNCKKPMRDCENNCRCEDKLVPINLNSEKTCRHISSNKDFLSTGHRECRLCGELYHEECQHELMPFKATDKWYRQAAKDEDEAQKCQHETSEPKMIWMSNPPQYKCIKCDSMYIAKDICEHEPSNDFSSFPSAKCKKCGVIYGIDFKVTEHKRYDHENDGLCHNIKSSPCGSYFELKCKKCGEFYK